MQEHCTRRRIAHSGKDTKISRIEKLKRLLYQARFSEARRKILSAAPFTSHSGRRRAARSILWERCLQLM